MNTKPSEASRDTSQPVTQEEDTAIRKASRPPLELLSAPDVAFVLNFKESEAGIAAQTRCDEEASDDPQANRACLAKARSKLAIELTQFQKDGSGQWWWVTYNNYKGNLLKWHKIQFMPGEETPSSIVLKPIGKDKGVAPMGRVPQALEIELPNDYSIVMNDREHGRLVFDAKIGLVRAEN